LEPVFLRDVNDLTCVPNPRRPVPIKPRRSRSFAPVMRPYAAAVEDAAAVPTEVLIKWRRETSEVIEFPRNE
jgi:hypothetical protein